MDTGACGQQWLQFTKQNSCGTESKWQKRCPGNKKTTKLNIIESEAPTGDKLTRLHTVYPKIEAGRVKLHAGGWNEAFINQVISFPIAQHDDEVDCLVAAIKRELMEDKGIDPGKMGFY